MTATIKDTIRLFLYHIWKLHSLSIYSLELRTIVCYSLYQEILGIVYTWRQKPTKLAQRYTECGNSMQWAQ